MVKNKGEDNKISIDIRLAIILSLFAIYGAISWSMSFSGYDSIIEENTDIYQESYDYCDIRGEYEVEICEDREEPLVRIYCYYFSGNLGDTLYTLSYNKSMNEEEFEWFRDKYEYNSGIEVLEPCVKEFGFAYNGTPIDSTNFEFIESKCDTKIMRIK